MGNVVSFWGRFILGCWFVVLCSCASSVSNSDEEEEQPVQFEKAVFRFGRVGALNTEVTSRFVYIEEPNGYALSYLSGEAIQEEVFYRKASGGAGPVVELHLINQRYLAYPETIKVSESSEMIAVTHVFDLEHGFVVWTSGEYQYFQNIPVDYRGFVDGKLKN